MNDNPWFQEVESVLKTVRPAMEADGGGVTLISVKDGRVAVQLKGMCLDCPSAPLTMKLGIERTLKQRLPWVTEVLRVDATYFESSEQNKQTN